ncbi:hypothetical protein B0G75_12727 [Paraburkholderia sp. BL18I3N2]|uniref:hypothetical protein n=1 Tax=Paraburkholderia sp. BL18I3N2 TaxID=1938799 RepID=UPI000D429620|nr:hypothetical protein [Paraburkholderia sp. BL18I3N2]PRX22421.1 hypothetical protein B0G75_12727 [Paraburkholderia sp. BL18I3N2]
MPATPQTSSATMTTAQDMPTYDVTVTDRVVIFIIYCAPLDAGNSMYQFVHPNDSSLYGVTDSASFLTRMPYVVVDADTKKVIFPRVNENGETAAIQSVSSTNVLHDGARKVHALPAIHIPHDVHRIALHIANDAFHYNRKFQLFAWTVPDVAHSKVHIYEMRSDLKGRFSSVNNITSPADNSLVQKPAVTDEYYGYLDGDLWLNISHEFTDQDITRLCPPETLSRNVLAGALQQTTPVGSIASAGATQTGTGIVASSTEQVHIDWLVALAPLYASGNGSRSMASFTVEITILNITLIFSARALANAINTSAHTTVQEALRRTSPRTFAAILKAAWRLHINTVSLSSSWRPMLGSRLHKMGLGLDVTKIEDSAEHVTFTIHNSATTDRGQHFPTGAAGQKMARLYQELNGDHEVLGGAVYTPWVNWVEPHDAHMHITVKDE